MKEYLQKFKLHPAFSDYSEDELNEELERLEELPAEIAACICGEILRRQRHVKNEQ